MRPIEIPDERGLCLYILRSLRGWTQGELAVALGTTSSVISEYESGKRHTSQRAVHRVAEAVGIPIEKVYGLLSLLHELQELMGSTPPAKAELIEVLVEGFYLGFEPLARKTVEMILTALRERKDFPPFSWDPDLAYALWDRLEPLDAEKRRLVVEVGREYQIWELCELICEESREAAEAGEASALELAELALHVAERIDGEDAWRWRVQGLAWAHIGYARRLRGDLAGAREAFARFRPLWEQGASADPGLLDESSVFGLEEPDPRSGSETGVDRRGEGSP